MIKNWNSIPNGTKIRVVFYGRVSTEHDEQLLAFENQKDWYERELDYHKNQWELAKPIPTYLDEGVTGTTVEGRNGFKKMIHDAKNSDDFDMVVTREMSRFARNTEQALKYVRELKEAGVAVYFVQDNINTMLDDNRLKFVLAAGVAEEESIKISKRVLAGQDIARKNKILYGNGNVLGYDRVRKRSDTDKRNAIGDKSVPTFEINEAQADTVRRIFDLYLQGNGVKKIKIALEKEHRLTASGNTIWHESTISRILDNPMYIGKQYQKKQSVKKLGSKQRVNNDRSEYVLVDGDFPPIISEETFRAVQSKREARVKFGTTYTSDPDGDKWKSRLECGCGSVFRRTKWHGDEKASFAYECRHRVVDGTEEYRRQHNLDTDGACSRKRFPEWHLDLMGILIFNSICKERKESVLDGFDLIWQHYVNERENNDKIIGQLKSQINSAGDKIKRLLELYMDGSLSKEEYKEARAGLDSEKKALEEKLKAEESKAEQFGRDMEDVKYEDMLRVVERMRRMFDFNNVNLDPALIKNFVDRIIVRDDTTFEWLICLSGEAGEVISPEYEYTTNTPIAERREITQRMIDREYRKIMEMTVDFEVALGYRKCMGSYVRPNQWEDLTVVVYAR